MQLTPARAKNFVPSQAAPESGAKLKYDYSLIGESDRRIVQAVAIDIKTHAEQSKQSMLTIGQKILKVKDMIPRGQFEKWCEVEFDFSKRFVEMVMNAAKCFAERGEIISLFNDTGLITMSAPSVPEEVREQVIAQAIETGKAPKVREIKQAIKDHKVRQGEIISPNSDPKPPAPTPLTLDETKAVIWKVLREQGPAETANTTTDKCVDWLNEHNVPADYIRSAPPDSSIDAVTFNRALYDVFADLRNVVRPTRPPTYKPEPSIRDQKIDALLSTFATLEAAIAGAIEAAKQAADLTGLWQPSAKAQRELNNVRLVMQPIVDELKKNRV